MRIHGFDFLRGLCAIMVAVYHMLDWSNTAHLHSWGLFGVYIFFVLSGASMVIAYRERLGTGMPVSTFLLYRFARLAPLYVLVMVINLYFVRDAARALMNATLLFGLANPGVSSSVTGGWSIGIEFAYYLMFPVLLSLAATRAKYWIGGLLAVTQLVFVNHLLSGTTLEAVWAAYVQPLSFVAYFYGGCLIGGAILDGARPSGRLVFIAAFVAILSASGPSATSTLTGLRGVALFGLVLAVVYYSAGFRVPTRLANFLGEVSYGTYLLHPIVFGEVTRRLGAPLYVSIPLALTLSVLAAFVSFRIYESKVQEWAKWRLRAPVLA